eukprot:1970876-Rhodomonas_salina.1
MEGRAVSKSTVPMCLSAELGDMMCVNWSSSNSPRKFKTSRPRSGRSRPCVKTVPAGSGSATTRGRSC